jgi:cytochrome P450
VDGITRTPAQDVVPPGCPVARVNPFAPDRMLDPFPYYRELQRDTPVAYVAEHDFWMVTSHALCIEVLRDPVAFRQWDGDELFQPGEGPPLGRPQNWAPEVREAMKGSHLPVSTLVNANPPRHTRYRRLATSLFSARRTADAMQERMYEIVNELIDKFPPHEVEFVAAFAIPFPLRVMSEVLGLPPDEYEMFKRWADSALVSIAGGVSTERLVEAAEDMAAFQRYLLGVVEKRRRHPTDDVLGYLANATLEVDGNQRLLNERETIGIALHLLTGGGETTTNLLGSLLNLILSTPGVYDRLRSDPSAVPAVIEEALRLESPFQALFRRTTRPVTLGGAEIPEEAKVLVVFGAANRDPGKFEHAESLDIDRPDGSAHVAFGFGTHFCLGAPLARREAEIALETILRRAQGLRKPVHKRVTQSDHAFMRGLITLDLHYDAVLPASTS